MTERWAVFSSIARVRDAFAIPFAARFWRESGFNVAVALVGDWQGKVAWPFGWRNFLLVR